MAGWTRLLGRVPSLRVPALGGVLTVAGAWAAHAAVPKPWEIGMQPAATPVQARLESFNTELTIIIALITAFVLGLLLYVMVRFNHRRHPVPTRTAHNTVIEILWTVIPVVILVIIAIPSFKLMYYMADVPDPHMTIKVTGHQWYWQYTYPGQSNLTFNSTIVQEANLKPGQLRLLTVDHPLVVPVDTNVRVLVGSTDVIHSWFIPSFGVQEYAMPGRENQSWFRVEHEGVYRGECNQLCGLNHAFMPIVIRVVSKDAFKSWLAGAKKEFASGDQGQSAVRVAALHGQSAVAPAPAGN